MRMSPWPRLSGGACASTRTWLWFETRRLTQANASQQASKTRPKRIRPPTKRREFIALVLRRWRRRCLSRSRCDRQFDEAYVPGLAEDSMFGLSEIARLGPENVRHERLRVAVVEREPAGLNLHHDPVPRQEDVVRRRQRERILQRRVRRNRLRIVEALAVATAKDVHRDSELIATHLGAAA